MLWYAVVLCLLGVSWAQNCQVANIQVMQNFDKTRVSQKHNQSSSTLQFSVLLCKVILGTQYSVQVLRFSFGWAHLLQVRRDVVCCGKEGPTRPVLT